MLEKQQRYDDHVNKAYTELQKKINGQNSLLQYKNATSQAQ